MWDLLKEIDWSDGAWKAAFFGVLTIFLYAVYQLIKFFGTRFITAFNKLTELSDKMDDRMKVIEGEQKMAHERFVTEQKTVHERFEKNDKHIDMMMRALLKATQQ